MLYGMTQAGGTNNASASSGNGTIFALNLQTHSYSTLYSFSGGADGASPRGSLIVSGNILYGSAGNNLFAFDTISNTKTTLHTFTGGTSDGALPVSAPLQSGNTLLGMTSSGGTNNLGTIFALDLSTNTETILHSFQGGLLDGASPQGTLMQIGNTLYGTTAGGGAFADGTIFSFDMNTSTLTLLHSFNGYDGGGASSGLVLVGGTLYGTSQESGQSGYGTIFSITIPEPSTLTAMVIALPIALFAPRRSPRR
jgi:uncharacterized repeat protein (TIGR03803 family)